MKLYPGKHILLLFIFFLSFGLSSCSPKANGPVLSTFYPLESTDQKYLDKTAAQSKLEPQPSDDNSKNALSPDETDALTPILLSVRGKNLTLGEDTGSLIHKLGNPNRILDTEYNFDFYIYHNDYTKLVFVAVKEDKIAGWYTDSVDFDFLNIRYGSDLDFVNQTLKSNYSLSKTIQHQTEHYTLTLLFDELETQKVTGIYLLSGSVHITGYDDTIMKNMELLMFDLTNSIRARNQLPVLSWSSSAALSARKHSRDMLSRHYFSHINPAKSTPGNRMSAEGISYTACGENIIKGFGSAILSNHAWYNSKSHRSNMLNKKFRYLGVGFTCDPDHPDQTYITQNYYR